MIRDLGWPLNLPVGAFFPLYQGAKTEEPKPEPRIEKQALAVEWTGEEGKPLPIVRKK